MKVNLDNHFKPGDVFNLSDGAYRILREGEGLDYLPGGAGVREYDVEKISDQMFTRKEISEWRKENDSFSVD